MEKRNKINKRLISMILAGMLTFAPVGCGKANTKTADTTAPATQTTTEATTEDIEVVTTEATTEEVVAEGLDITNNASIEKVVDESYEKYQEFYDETGIDKDQIRNMIFFINDKYTDEAGSPVFTEDEMALAYCNVERIMLPYKVSQKIDNINTINNGDIKPEDDGIIIPEIPKISDFIDQNISGGKITARKTKEWEDELDKQRKLMNESRTFDIDSINAFIKKNEVTDFNNDDTGLSSSTVNGFLFVISDQHKYALRMAGAMQPQVIYIEGNDGIDEIKINAYNEERKVEDLVENLKEENLLDAAKTDEVVNYVVALYENGQATTPEEIAAAYGLGIDNSDLLIDYAIFLSTMEYYQYERIDCNRKRQAHDKLNEIITNNKTSSLNGTRKLVLNA